MRDGKSFLPEPLVLDARDSGTEEFPVVYAAYPGEQPVLSGGRQVGGWAALPGKDRAVRHPRSAGRQVEVPPTVLQRQVPNPCPLARFRAPESLRRRMGQDGGPRRAEKRNRLPFPPALSAAIRPSRPRPK